MNLPKPGADVLAKIISDPFINGSGLASWYEVVYHDGDRWRTYNRSETFDDGGRVEAWVYCDRIMFPSGPLVDPEYGGVVQS
jgi:hypothetical protein